jgi:hypothetical protein
MIAGLVFNLKVVNLLRIAIGDLHRVFDKPFQNRGFGKGKDLSGFAVRDDKLLCYHLQLSLGDGDGDFLLLDSLEKSPDDRLVRFNH